LRVFQRPPEPPFLVAVRRGEAVLQSRYLGLYVIAESTDNFDLLEIGYGELAPSSFNSGVVSLSRFFRCGE
jgi:hypothetical protein